MKFQEIIDYKYTYQKVITTNLESECKYFNQMVKYHTPGIDIQFYEVGHWYQARY